MAIPKLSDQYRNWYILKGYEIHEYPEMRFWYLNGKRHREDGPAVEFASGAKFWYKNNKYHREGGPAVEHSNGDREWYLNGEWMTEEEHQKAVKEIMKNAT